MRLQKIPFSPLIFLGFGIAHEYRLYRWTIPLTKLTLPPEEGATVTVGIRPEAFKRGGDARLNLTVEIVEHLGDETFAYARQAGGQVVTISVSDGRALRPGQTISATFDPAKAQLFGKSGKRIR